MDFADRSEQMWPKDFCGVFSWQEESSSAKTPFSLWGVKCEINSFLLPPLTPIPFYPSQLLFLSQPAHLSPSLSCRPDITTYRNKLILPSPVSSPWAINGQFINKQGSSFMKLSPQFPDVFINIFWNICLKKWFWSLENKQIWGRERHQVYLWSSTIPPRCSQLGFPTWILQDLASSNIHL